MVIASCGNSTAQAVEVGHDVPALHAGDQILDAATLQDDEAEVGGDVAAQAVGVQGSGAASRSGSPNRTR